MTENATEPTPVILVHPDSPGHEVQAAPSQVEKYTSQGWRVKAEDAPKGNASLEDWQAYARVKDFSDEDIEGKTRDELRAALA